VVATGDGTDVVLVHCRSGQSHPLDDRGRAVWALIAEGHSVASMIARVAEECGAPAERAEAEVLAVVDQLLVNGFVVGTR